MNKLVFLERHPHPKLLHVMFPAKIPATGEHCDHSDASHLSHIMFFTLRSLHTTHQLFPVLRSASSASG